MNPALAIALLSLGAADALHVAVNGDPSHPGSENGSTRDLFSHEAQARFSRSIENGTTGEDVLERQRRRQGPILPDRPSGHPIHNYSTATTICDGQRPHTYCNGRGELRTVGVVVSTYSEDLSWLKKHQGPITVYVHNRTRDSYAGVGWDSRVIQQARESEWYLQGDNDKRTHPVEVVHIPNVGDEAAGYLEYITTKWNDLPDLMFFIHGHRCSDHQSFDMLSAIPELAGCFSDSEGYVHLGDRLGHPVCYQGLNLTHPPSVQAKVDQLKRMWPILFEKELGAPLPEPWCMDVDAQFAVTKERLQYYPLEFYRLAFESVINGQTSFEYYWRMIFMPRSQKNATGE